MEFKASVRHSGKLPHAVFMIPQNLCPRRGVLRPLGVYIFVASSFEILELHHFPKARSLDPAKMNNYSYTSGMLQSRLDSSLHPGILLRSSDLDHQSQSPVH
jgi:hypothetical protein